MIQSTPARVSTAFERRKAKGRRTVSLEPPAQAAMILTWTPITHPRLVERAVVLGMEEAPGAHLTTLRTRYPRRFRRMRGQAGLYSLPLLHHLSQHLSHLRRFNHIVVIRGFFNFLLALSQL